MRLQTGALRATLLTRSDRPDVQGCAGRG
jgi:hypothetical protein